MLAAITIILIAAILCGSVLFGAYMEYCSENKIGMFEGSKIQNRIDGLEEEIQELKTMVSDMRAEKK